MATPPDAAAQLEQLKNAPLRAKRVATLGTLLGLIVLLSFCVSAFLGFGTWGRALASGIIQLLLLWYASFSVQARQQWAWWVLFILVLLRVWGGFGHTLRLARVTVEGGLGDHGGQIAFDALGVGQFAISLLMLWLLCSREVRDYIFKKDGNGSSEARPA